MFAAQLRPALLAVRLTLEASDTGTWSGGGGNGSKSTEAVMTVAARVAADQASRNFRRKLLQAT